MVLEVGVADQGLAILPVIGDARRLLGQRRERRQLPEQVGALPLLQSLVIEQAGQLSDGFDDVIVASVQCSGRISSSGDDFLPAPFFIR